MNRTEKRSLITDLIWDAGGTLFDTYPSVVRAFGAALQTWGVTLSPAEILPLVRRSRDYAAHALAASLRLEPEALLAEFRRCYDAAPAAAQPPFPGARELCAHIVAQGGHNFIVTHRRRSSLLALLEAHGMTDYFTAAITKEDPYPRKPDPTALEALVQHYTLDRYATLAIGDREIDMQAARAAGLRTCFFGAAPHGQPVDYEVADFFTLLRQLEVAANQEN